MKAIDTNVLVRFLVGDDENQAKKVYDLFKGAEQTGERFFVPLLVVLELLWVLESVYDVPRREILESLNELTFMSVLRFESQDVIHRFIDAAYGNLFDLSDLLIAHSSKDSGCDKVLTFDKRASSHELFEMIE